MNKIVKAHIALFIANLIYGGNYTVAKEIMPDYIMPFGIILIRVIAALFIYSVFTYFFINEKIDKKDYLKLGICGLFGVAINQLLFFKGLSITTPINAAVIMTTNPILVLIAASILIKEVITFQKIVGICLGAMGAIVLILFGNNFSLGSETLSGDLMVFLNSMSYGAYLVLVKPLMEKYHPLTVIKWVFCFGALFVIPVGYDDFMKVEWAVMPASIWGALAYVVIGTTCIAYLCNTFALKTLNASVVSTYIYSQPLFAGIIALSFAKDELTLIKVVSAVLIFIGVYLVSKPKTKTT
ncbi:MAG: DMT family transporter, partial [Bacteroidia bacterium]|nr:DMT family transporter [Bacteroidia bacterium]